MSWVMNTMSFDKSFGHDTRMAGDNEFYSDLEVVYGLPKARRPQRLKKVRKRRVNSATGPQPGSPGQGARPSSVPLAEGITHRWQGVKSEAVHAYSAMRLRSPSAIPAFSPEHLRPQTGLGPREMILRARPQSQLQMRSEAMHEMARPHTSDGVQQHEPWTRTRGLTAAHDALMVQRQILTDERLSPGAALGEGAPMPLAPSTNQAKWFASAISQNNLRTMLRNLRTSVDATLEDIKPHNRALLASLFELRASDSIEPPASPRLTGRLPKELLIGILNGLQILEPLDKDREDAELRWSTTRKVLAVEKENSKGSVDSTDEQMGSVSLSWVLGWLRRRRMQSHKDAVEREWTVSGQSLDSLSWADFKSFFRAVARKVLSAPHDLDKDETKAQRRAKQEISVSGGSRPGVVGSRIDAFDSVKPSMLFEEQLDEAAAEAMPEILRRQVGGLFRQFEPTGNGTSCGLDTLRSSLYMNGYTHRAVTTMIEDAAKAVEEEQREHANQSQAHSPKEQTGEPRVSAPVFARILASFHANKRAETNDTRKFNNCVRLLVVRAGVVADLLPSLRALQTAVFPRFVDAAIELGGTVDVEHVTLDDYTDWLTSPGPATLAERCMAPAMGVEEFHKLLAECKLQVGHVVCLFLCDATLGQRRLARTLREGELSLVLQQLRKRPDSNQNLGLRTQNRVGEDSRYSRLAQLLESCYSTHRYDGERQKSDNENARQDSSGGSVVLTGDLELLRSAHDGVSKLMAVEPEDSEIVQALAPAWQPTTALQILTEMLTNALDTTFIAVRDGRDRHMQPAGGARELMELLEKVPRDHVTWYPVVPEDSLARSQRQAVNLVDKVRMARTKLTGAIALGLRAKHWSLSEQHSEMDAISEARWLSHVQVDCYNQLATPLFQSLLKDTTYHEQRGHERELVRVFESIDRTVRLPQHKSQKLATRALARYVEHSVNAGSRSEEVELATQRQKAQAQSLSKHVQDSLHSYQEAIRLGSAEWSLLDDELQFPIYTDKTAAHQAMLELPIQAKQKASSILGDKWVGMTFPERLVVVITIMEVERLLGDEEGVSSEKERTFSRESSATGPGPHASTDDHHTLHRQNPVLVLGHRGVGKTSAIVLALKQAECMGQLFAEQTDETAKDEALRTGFDGRVDSTVILRVVGATEVSTNGNDLLRSIVMQIREEYDPQNHLQMAVPATLEDLEKGLLTAMGMATLHRPLVVIVDGIDRLHPRDPARRMLWVPKSLPFHCRLIVVATPELKPSETQTMFHHDNVIEIQPPPLVALQALAEEIAATEGKRRQSLSEAELTDGAVMFDTTGSLSLLKLSVTFAVQPGWVVQRRQGGHLPFVSADKGLQVADAFDEVALGCLSMLAMSRGGLTLPHMEHAWRLYLQRTALLASGGGTEQEQQATDAVKRETFDASVRGLGMMTNRKMHGKCVVIVLDDPWIEAAVRSSPFYEQSKAEICDCLITAAYDTSTRYMPVYMQTSVLPALQIQAARFSGALKEELPDGVDGTLCCTKFLRLKVEAGLLEDLLNDMQECLTALALGEFLVSESCERTIRRHREILTCNKQLLLKPFHSLLVDQMKTKTGGRGRECRPTDDTQWSQELPRPDHWHFAEVSNEHVPAVYCTASLLNPCATTSCAVGAGRSSVVYAVGLEDGTVTVWDGVSGDRIGHWKAHESRVVICHFVQRQVENVEEWVQSADGAAAGIGVMSGTERGLDESCWWFLLTAGCEGDVRLWSIPDFEQVLRHPLNASSGSFKAPGNRTAMLSGTLKGGDEIKAGRGNWTCCDSRPLGPDGMVVCFGSTCGQVYAAALLSKRREMIAMDTTSAHEQAVTSVSLSREWCLLASCSRDSSVRIWEFGISGKLVCMHKMVVEGSHLFWCRFQGPSLFCSGQGVVREWSLTDVEVGADPASVLSTVDMNHFLAQQEKMQSPSRRRASEIGARRGSIGAAVSMAARRQSIAGPMPFDVMSVQDSPSPGNPRFSPFQSTAATPTRARRQSVAALMAPPFLSVTEGVAPRSPQQSKAQPDWNVKSMELGGGSPPRRRLGSPGLRVQISPVGPVPGLQAASVSPSTGLASPPSREAPPQGMELPGEDLDISRTSSAELVSTTPDSAMAMALQDTDADDGKEREDLVSEQSTADLLAPKKGHLVVTEGHQLQLKNGQAMKMRHCGMLTSCGVMIACHGMQVVFWDVTNQKKEVLKMRNKATCSAMSLDGGIVLLGFTDNRLRAWHPRADTLPDEIKVSATDLASTGGLFPMPDFDSPPASTSGLSNLAPKFRSALRPPPGSPPGGQDSPSNRSKSPPSRQMSGAVRLRTAVLGAGMSRRNLDSGGSLLKNVDSSGERLQLVANMVRMKGNLKRAQQRRHEWELLQGAFRSYGAQNNPLIDSILRKTKKSMRAEEEEEYGGGDVGAAEWGGVGLNEEEEGEDWERAELHGLFRSPDLHASEVQNLSVSHDGALVMSVADGTIRVWDTATGRMLQAIGRRAGYGDVRLAVFSPKLPASHAMSDDDRDLAMVAWSYHQIVLLRVTDPERIVMEIGTHDLDIRTAKFAPDGTFAVTGSWDNTTCVWQLVRKDKASRAGRNSPPPGPSARKGPARSGNASPVASARKDTSPPPWELARSGAMRNRSPSPESPPGSPQLSPVAALMPRKMSSTSIAREARESREQRAEKALLDRRLVQHAHKNSVLSVGVCPHSKFVASTSADHTLVVYSVACGQDPPAIEMWTGHHGSFVQACDFSRSGKMIASVGGDRICRVWETESGRILHVLKTSGALTSVKFSANDGMVAAGGLRGALQVWSVATGESVGGRPHPVMCDQMCTVTSLAWTPDSRAVMVSGTDGTVWGWDCVSGVLAGCFQTMAVSSYAGVDEHDQGFSHEWFELPGVWCAAYHFDRPSPVQHTKPKPKEPTHFQSSPVLRRPPTDKHPPAVSRSRSRTPEPPVHTNSDPLQHPLSPDRKSQAKSEEGEELGFDKSALVVLGTRTGFVHILRISDWRAAEGEARGLTRMGRHMHSVLHHQSHHTHARAEGRPDELMHQIRLYSHAKHIAKSLTHDQDGEEAAGSLDAEFKSVRGRRDFKLWDRRKKTMAEQECRKLEAEMFKQLEGRARKEQVMFGWLGKLKQGGDPASEADWNTRLCFAVEDEFRYISQKEGGKPVKICDFHSVSAFEMVDFSCPGRNFAFTLRFAEEDDSITFAAEIDEERCWWMEAVVEALAKKGTERRGDMSSTAANHGTMQAAEVAELGSLPRARS